MRPIHIKFYMIFYRTEHIYISTIMDTTIHPSQEPIATPHYQPNRRNLQPPPENMEIPSIPTNEEISSLEYQLLMGTPELQNQTLTSKLYHGDYLQDDHLYQANPNKKGSYRVRAPNDFIQKIRSIYFVMVWARYGQGGKENDEYKEALLGEGVKHSQKQSMVQKNVLSLEAALKIFRYRHEKSQKNQIHAKYIAEFFQFLDYDCSRQKQENQCPVAALLNKYPIMDQIFIDAVLEDLSNCSQESLDDNYTIVKALKLKYLLPCTFVSFWEFEVAGMRVIIRNDGFQFSRQNNPLGSLAEQLQIGELDVSRVDGFHSRVFEGLQKSYIADLESVLSHSRISTLLFEGEMSNVSEHSGHKESKTFRENDKDNLEQIEEQSPTIINVLPETIAKRPSPKDKSLPSLWEHPVYSHFKKSQFSKSTDKIERKLKTEPKIEEPILVKKEIFDFNDIRSVSASSGVNAQEEKDGTTSIDLKGSLIKETKVSQAYQDSLLKNAQEDYATKKFNIQSQLRPQLALSDGKSSKESIKKFAINMEKPIRANHHPTHSSHIQFSNKFDYPSSSQVLPPKNRPSNTFHRIDDKQTMTQQPYSYRVRKTEERHTHPNREEKLGYELNSKKEMTRFDSDFFHVMEKDIENILSSIRNKLKKCPSVGESLKRSNEFQPENYESNVTYQNKKNNQYNFSSPYSKYLENRNSLNQDKIENLKQKINKEKQKPKTYQPIMQQKPPLYPQTSSQLPYHQTQINPLAKISKAYQSPPQWHPKEIPKFASSQNLPQTKDYRSFGHFQNYSQNAYHEPYQNSTMNRAMPPFQRHGCSFINPASSQKMHYEKQKLLRRLGAKPMVLPI